VLRVNRRLGLVRIHAQDRETGLPATQKSAGVNRAKRSLQIGRRDKPRSNIGGEAPLKNALQAALVGDSRGPIRRRSALVSLPANLEFFRTRLPQPLHCQPQHFMLDFDI
jgi:hypothetical protein